MCLICRRKSLCPPLAEPCLGKEFFCWLWDFSFQEREPSRELLGQESSWVRRAPATAQAVQFCTLMSPGAMNFSLSEQTQHSQQNVRTDFTEPTLHSTRESCTCLHGRGERKPKVPAFQGNRSLIVLEILIHRKVITQAPDPEFTGCSCSIRGRHRGTFWIRI